MHWLRIQSIIEVRGLVQSRTIESWYHKNISIVVITYKIGSVFAFSCSEEACIHYL